MPGARLIHATVAFADIVGFTALSERLGPERAYRAVTECLRLLDGIARKQGGAVDKYLGDALMVVFGHPLPHPAPVRAACAAALEMRRRVRERARELRLPVPLDLVVGINSGPMVAGDIRGPVIREFHVLGDAVNVAARLKARAPAGAIWVGPETYACAREQGEFRKLPALRLKGKAEAVAIYELVRERDERIVRALREREEHRTKLVGRQAELARLADAASRLANGPGGIVALVGEEGSGKSRLLLELAASGVLDRAALLDVIDGELPQQRPLVVALDGLDEADERTLAALARALPLAAAQAVLFVLAFRPGGSASARVVDLLRTFAHDEIHLGPLDDEAASALAGEVAGDEPLSDADRRLLLERARGNPQRLILGVFLAAALRSEREHAVERSNEAERRRATVLFADITGFTAMTERLGAEAAYPIVSGALALLDETARRHGGTVDKYLGDCVMALFGVPRAIEDAPRAALNAAIEMRRRVREYNREHALEAPLDVHCGIDTGLGIAGDVSGPLLREFALMGDAVEVADRLKDAAPAGAIWVGGEAHRATRERFEFRALEPIALRGRDVRVSAFELLSHEERLHRVRAGAGGRVFSPLVGREAEVEALSERLRRLHAGEGGLVSVIAQAGLGKSRLLAEVARSEPARGVEWLEGRSLTARGQLAFHPFADLCRVWARIGDEDDEGGSRAKLEAAMDRVLPDASGDVLPFVASILGVRLTPDERERLERIPGDALERMFRRALGELLRRTCALSPTVVVMDDVHWADASSVELLGSLRRLVRGHRILFIDVARPGFAATSQRLLELARKEYADRHLELLLEPLAAASSHRLLANLFGAGGLPHAVRTRIEEKAKGNPFYIEEVVRALADDGAVEWVDGRFRATDRIHTVEIPGSVQEVVMARVDGLPLRKRQALQIASVIGGTFHADVLEQVAGGAETLRGDVAELIEAEFLVAEDRTHGVEYAFKHPLLQEVTYDGILEARREELHREVAEAILERLPEELPGYCGMLAWHFSMGRDLARAEEFLFRAGDEAARVAASNEALHFFRESSRLYFELHGDGGDPEKRAALEQNVATALYHRGQFIEAVEHFNRALEVLGERVPRGQVAVALRFAGNLAFLLARLYLAGGASRRGRASPGDRQVIELMYARAQAQTTASPARFLFDSTDTLARLERVDAASVPGAARIFAGAVGIFSYGGLSFDVGRRFLELSRRALDASDVRQVAMFRCMDFVHHLLAGDWAEAHEMDDALVAESLRFGSLWEITTYLGLLGTKHVHCGSFDRAGEALARIDEIWDAYLYDLAKTNHYYLPTILALERGSFGEAIAAADAYYDENPEDLLHVLALSSKAKAQVLAGDLPAAEATLALAAQVVARARPVPPLQRSDYLRSRCLLDLARLEEAASAPDRGELRQRERRARASARAALRAAGRVAWRQPEALRLAGSVEWIAGARERAERRWLASVERSRRLGTRPELGRAALEIGRRLREAGGADRELGGASATAWLDLARRTFDELGMEPERGLDPSGSLAP